MFVPSKLVSWISLVINLQLIAAGGQQHPSLSKALGSLAICHRRLGSWVWVCFAEASLTFGPKLASSVPKVWGGWDKGISDFCWLLCDFGNICCFTLFYTLVVGRNWLLQSCSNWHPQWQKPSETYKKQLGTVVVKAVQAFPIQTHRLSQLCSVFVDSICDMEVTLTFVNGLDFQLLPQCRVKYEQEGLEDFCVASTWGESQRCSILNMPINPICVFLFQKQYAAAWAQCIVHLYNSLYDLRMFEVDIW